MDTNFIMSSLREMIDAAIEAKTAATHDQAEAARLHYSRHETVVREGLQQLGAAIPVPAHVERQNRRRRELEAMGPVWDKAIRDGLKNLACYLCGKRLRVGPNGIKPHECHPKEP